MDGKTPCALGTFDAMLWAACVFEAVLLESDLKV